LIVCVEVLLVVINMSGKLTLELTLAHEAFTHLPDDCRLVLHGTAHPTTHIRDGPFYGLFEEALLSLGSIIFNYLGSGKELVFSVSDGVKGLNGADNSDNLKNFETLIGVYNSTGRHPTDTPTGNYGKLSRSV
jgi:hypothetical protein